MGEEKIYDKIYLKQLSFIWFFISWLRDQMAITFLLFPKHEGKANHFYIVCLVLFSLGFHDCVRISFEVCEATSPYKVHLFLDQVY